MWVGSKNKLLGNRGFSVNWHRLSGPSGPFQCQKDNKNVQYVLEIRWHQKVKEAWVLLMHAGSFQWNY